MIGTIAISPPERSPAVGPPPFEVRIRPHREAVQLRLVGELDVTTTAQLRAGVEDAVTAGFSHVVIDLRGLVFMDCAGLRLLLVLSEVARRGSWRLSLVHAPDAVRRLFALTATLDVLPFVSPTAISGARPGLKRRRRPNHARGQD
ncbi:STAS domain-containing protein [Capillimicrobium parvum]|uniref:Anti-sigma factor antagonist n=1 Tax=Capillimicrobium parvum TaxID=2884022 RepID=A0A9E6XVB5_9ACTN|nr:STAS domain-containing protein [Capillimicrobium parvum]UGS34778.1 hypothetical protein DSM104329_01160 [Capillimicrobium parvum]